MLFINKYIREIIRLRKNHHNPAVIWVMLCQSYYKNKCREYGTYYSTAKNTFFPSKDRGRSLQCAKHYAGVVDGEDQKYEAPKEDNFFYFINTCFPHHTFDEARSSFKELLCAFMTLFPDCLHWLRPDIANMLSIHPFQPFSQKKIKEWIFNLMQHLVRTELRSIRGGNNRWVRKYAAEMLGKISIIIPEEMKTDVFNALKACLKDPKQIVIEAAQLSLVLLSKTSSLSFQKKTLDLLEKRLSKDSDSIAHTGKALCIFCSFAPESLLRPLVHRTLFQYKKNAVQLEVLGQLFKSLPDELLRQQIIEGGFMLGIYNRTSGLRRTAIHVLCDIEADISLLQKEFIVKMLGQQLVSDHPEVVNLAAEVLAGLKPFIRCVDTSIQIDLRDTLTSIIAKFDVRKDQFTASAIIEVLEIFADLPAEQAQTRHTLLKIVKDRAKGSLSTSAPRFLLCHIDKLDTLSDEERSSVTDELINLIDKGVPDDCILCAKAVASLFPLLPRSKQKKVVTDLNKIKQDASRPNSHSAAIIALIYIHQSAQAPCDFLLGTPLDDIEWHQQVVREAVIDALPHLSNFPPEFQTLLIDALHNMLVNDRSIAIRQKVSLFFLCDPNSDEITLSFKQLAMTILNPGPAETDQPEIQMTAARLLAKTPSLPNHPHRRDLFLNLVACLTSHHGETRRAATDTLKFRLQHFPDERHDIIPCFFEKLVALEEVSCEIRLLFIELITTVLDVMTSPERDRYFFGTIDQVAGTGTPEIITYTGAHEVLAVGFVHLAQQYQTEHLFFRNHDESVSLQLRKI